MLQLPNGGASWPWIAGALALCLLALMRLFTLVLETIRQRRRNGDSCGEGTIPFELDDSDRRKLDLIPAIHDATGRLEREAQEHRAERIIVLRLLERIASHQDHTAAALRASDASQAKIATLLDVVVRRTEQGRAQGARE